MAAMEEYHKADLCIIFEFWTIQNSISRCTIRDI